MSDSRSELKNPGRVVATLILVCGFVQGGTVSNSGFGIVTDAVAAGGQVTDPAGKAPDRYVCYLGTEALYEDEIRVVVCGSGSGAANGVFAGHPGWTTR
jgi:hypothetical protein